MPPGCGGSFLFLLSFFPHKVKNQKKKEEERVAGGGADAAERMLSNGVAAGDAAELPRPPVVELRQDDDVVWYGLMSQSNRPNDVC